MYYKFFPKLSLKTCKKLKKVTLEKTISNLTHRLFLYCSSLETIVITTEEEITFPYRRDELFQDVNSLREVLVNDGNTKYKSENGILYRIEDNAIIIDPNNL